MLTYNVAFGIRVSVVIERDLGNDLAFVKVIAPLYRRKEWTMNHCYKASDFTDYQILRDLDFIRVMTNAFGV